MPPGEPILERHVQILAVRTAAPVTRLTRRAKLPVVHRGEAQLPDTLLSDLARQARASPRFGFSVAMAVRDLIRAAVRNLYPDREHAWPLLRAGVAWEAYLVVPDDYLVLVLRGHQADIGSGGVTLIPAQGFESPASESGEAWLDRLRARFRATGADGFFVLPLLLVSEDSGAIMREWIGRFGDRVRGQVVHNLAHNARHLGLPPPGAPKAIQPGGESPNALEHRGNEYAITFNGRRFVCGATRGMALIARLLERPNEDHFCLRLLDRHGDYAGDAAVDEDGLRKLKGALEDAEELGNAEEAESIRAEIRRQFGRGGRSRVLCDAVERARKTAGKAIREAITRIREHDPELGDHLLLHIAKPSGRFVAYRPPAGFPPWFVNAWGR